MTQIRSLMLGAALTAFATTAAFAQTAAQAGADLSAQAPAAQGVQPVAPAPQNLAAPGSSDPLVQKREADAQAKAEYKTEKKHAKQQYKDQVKNAKITEKADKETASDQLKAATPKMPANQGTQN
jgi:hypothetical protein